MTFSILGPMNLVKFIKTSELLLKNQNETYLKIVLKLFMCMRLNHW